MKNETFTVVSNEVVFDGDNSNTVLHVARNLTPDMLAEHIQRFDDDSKYLIFRGAPVTAKIETQTRLVFDNETARKRKPRAPKPVAAVDDEAPYGRRKDGTPKAKPGRKS